MRTSAKVPTGMLLALTVACSGGRRPEVYAGWPFDTAEAQRRQKETAKALRAPVERDLKLAGDVTIRMVLIPAGQFVIGSPEREERLVPNAGQKRVTIGQPFWLGKYEVTQAQWEAVMGGNPSEFKGAGNPLEMVSWHAVQDFLRKANTNSSNARFALPTEAQWEYACRAGSAGAYSFGDDPAGLARYAWGSENSDLKTHPVGKLLPNAWGLHDMHGNVAEWCASPYSQRYDGSESRRADPQGGLRVLRGGSWCFPLRNCRSDVRVGVNPEFARPTTGFRVALLPTALP